MSCRCKDIDKCTRNMNKIEEIQTILSTTENTNYFVSSELASLASNSFFAFYCVNMNDLMSEEKKLNEDVINILPQLVRECKDQYNELDEKLTSMRSEDHHYHEEKRKHHHHNDD